MVIPELIHATYILTAGVSFSCRTLRFTVRTNAFIRPNHRECVVRRTTPVDRRARLVSYCISLLAELYYTYVFHAYSPRSACVAIVRSLYSCWVTPDNLLTSARTDSFESDGAATFECLPYQLSTVRYVRPMALTGNGESGFDSGEAA